MRSSTLPPHLRSLHLEPCTKISSPWPALTRQAERDHDALLHSSRPTYDPCTSSRAPIFPSPGLLSSHKYSRCWRRSGTDVESSPRQLALERARQKADEKRERRKQRRAWGGAVLARVQAVASRMRVGEIASGMPVEVLRLCLGSVSRDWVACRVVCQGWHAALPWPHGSALTCLSLIMHHLEMPRSVLRVTAVSSVSRIILHEARARMMTKMKLVADRERERACKDEWMDVRVLVYWPDDDWVDAGGFHLASYQGIVIGVCKRGLACRVRFDEPVGNGTYGACLCHTIVVGELHRVGPAE